jgi:hypothetical protein
MAAISSGRRYLEVDVDVGRSDQALDVVVAAGNGIGVQRGPIEVLPESVAGVVLKTTGIVL